MGKLLGEWLIERGWAAEPVVQQALRAQKHAENPEKIGELLVTSGAITEDQLAEALAAQMGVPLWRAEAEPVDPELKALIPPSLAQTCRVFPQSARNGSLRCIASGPVSPSDVAKLEFLSGKQIHFALTTGSELARRLRELYGLSVQSLIADMDASGGDQESDHEIYVHDLREMAQEPTLVNLVNAVITSAIAERASDIHVEPFEAELRVKYRIDGTLLEMAPPPKQFQSAIVSRIKIMAGMDIAERYVPQDGQIRVNLPNAKVDIRVSTVPTVFGESVVMRLLNKDETLHNLAQLGMDPGTHERFSTLLHLPYGILLVCGPTGSGKTTTLYGALREIYTSEKKIITIEDPVEYQMNGVNQIPVRPKRGLTFASGLRSILRQDPDIIMVGEIRDRETADIAIRAALTGHLVFSTLHTNDAPGAITRLMDMGVEPFLIASAVQGVLGQRLVRRLCSDCRKAVTPDPGLLKEFEAKQLPEVIYEPASCNECRNRGYRGRVGIFELLTITQRLHDLILSTANSGEVKNAARASMRTMRQDGWDKIASGATSVAEVIHATRFDVLEGA